MGLTHEVPTGLRVRPMVTLRLVPGQVLRVPTRAGTLLLGAVVLWGALAGMTALPWMLLAGLVLVPAVLAAVLVEAHPHGRPPLVWVWVLIRHLRRPSVLVVTRTVDVVRDHGR